MSDASTWLSKTGLSNFDTPKVTEFKDREVEIVKYKYRAHCTSYSCSQRTEHGSIIIPNISKHAVDCPRCGNVIFWERYV